jgi:hypothetical protein
MSEPARRITAAQIIEKQLEVMGRSSTRSRTVTLIRNAKANTQIELVNSSDDMDDATSFQALAEATAAVYDWLCLRYPPTPDTTTSRS